MFCMHHKVHASTYSALRPFRDMQLKHALSILLGHLSQLMYAHIAYNTFLGSTCIGLQKQFEHPTDIPGTCRHAHDSNFAKPLYACYNSAYSVCVHCAGDGQYSASPRTAAATAIQARQAKLKLLSATALLAANTGSHAPLATYTRSHALLPANTDHTPGDMRQLVSHSQVLQCTAAQHYIKKAMVHFMLSFQNLMSLLRRLTTHILSLKPLKFVRVLTAVTQLSMMPDACRSQLGRAMLQTCYTVWKAVCDSLLPPKTQLWPPMRSFRD